MYVSSSELQLRRARMVADPQDAIAAYMLVIDEAVRELKEIRPASRTTRRR